MGSVQDKKQADEYTCRRHHRAAAFAASIIVLLLLSQTPKTI